jgi:hypothetical protein
MTGASAETSAKVLRSRPRSGASRNLARTWVPPVKSMPNLSPGIPGLRKPTMSHTRPALTTIAEIMTKVFR